jgi:hypothetical protein
MSTSQAYRIADEPTPGGLAHLVTNPIWPLFGMMLAGTWLGLPWFVLNSHAIGSATRWRETAAAALGLAGAGILVVGGALCFEYMAWPQRFIPYFLVIVAAFKLAIAYGIYFLQARSFAIHEHFGGQTRNGLLVVLIAAFALRSKVLQLTEGMLSVVLM